jgi:hypothetical protein
MSVCGGRHFNVHRSAHFSTNLIIGCVHFKVATERIADTGGRFEEDHIGLLYSKVKWPMGNPARTNLIPRPLIHNECAVVGKIERAQLLKCTTEAATARSTVHPQNQWIDRRIRPTLHKPDGD